MPSYSDEQKPVYTSDDPLDIEGQAQAAEDVARIERFLQEQARDDLLQVMSSRAGRRFVWDLIDYCGMWRGALGKNLKYHEGRRSVGLVLWGRLQEASPELLMEMQRENLHD